MKIPSRKRTGTLGFKEHFGRESGRHRFLFALPFLPTQMRLKCLARFLSLYAPGDSRCSVVSSVSAAGGPSLERFPFPEIFGGLGLG